MVKDKTYRYDDAFKAKARAHQFAFRENVLNDYYDEKNPQVILSPDAAQKGLIFCDVYRDFIRQRLKGKKFGKSAVFSNMLRSEHIPYNIFTPMEEDPENAKDLFNQIIGGGISRIISIKIEFAGDGEISEYLNDGTSFDTYIEYVSENGQRGGIGIEVKYTENGYPLGEKEEKDLKNPDSRYHKITSESDYFNADTDLRMFLKANHLRQIWRNHILGYSMISRGDIHLFHHIHLYPQGNSHFHSHALPEYKCLLTQKGKESFVDLTYESLLNLMEHIFTSAKQGEWIKYLKKRYLLQQEL